MPLKGPIALSTAFTLLATTALAQTSRDEVIEQLTEQGFTRIAEIFDLVPVHDGRYVDLAHALSFARS